MSWKTGHSQGRRCQQLQVMEPPRASQRPGLPLHNTWPSYVRSEYECQSDYYKSKNPFKLQAKPMDFNVTAYKMSIDMVSDSTLQLT